MKPKPGFWKAFMLTGAVAMSAGIGGLAATVPKAADAAGRPSVLTVETFHHVRTLIFETDTPAAIIRRPKSLARASSTLADLWAKGRPYDGQLPPEKPIRAVVNAYVGPPVLTVVTTSGTVYTVHPAIRIILRGRSFKKEYFPPVVVVKSGSSYHRMADPALYRWFMRNGWKAVF